MAKNIDFMGAVFPDVPSIRLPQQGGGLVSFDDTTDATATAADIAEGKTAYVNGEKLTGTGSGGGVTVEALNATQNGTYTAPEGTAYSPVTVNVSGGGGPVASKDVDFIDFDGTVLYSYSASEFAGLTEMPPNPSHTGLTAQGWNWNLTDAKTYVAARGQLVVGQMYVTDDGKTRLYISIPEPGVPLAQQMQVRFRSSKSSNVQLDWGDGTVETKGSTSATSYSHTYAAAGDYVITLEVTSGTIDFTGTSGSANILGSNSSSSIYKRAWLRKLEIGADVTDIGQYALQQCNALESVTIPSTTKVSGTYALESCFALPACVLPTAAKSLGTYAFNNCVSLLTVSFPCGMTSIGQSAFSSTRCLKRATIPSTVTSVGASCFSSASALTYADLPASMTGTLGGSTFSACPNLRSAEIPEGITSIVNAYPNANALAKVTIPSTVTSIGTNAFVSCYNLREVHFKPATPPTLANSNAFGSLPTSCKIYVPTGSLSAYTSASNYPSSSSYTYVEE